MRNSNNLKLIKRSLAESYQLSSELTQEAHGKFKSRVDEEQEEDEKIKIFIRERLRCDVLYFFSGTCKFEIDYCLSKDSIIVKTYTDKYIFIVLNKLKEAGEINYQNDEPSSYFGWLSLR